MPVKPVGRDAVGPTKFAEELAKLGKTYDDIDIKDIETRKVEVKTVDEHGNVTTEIKEMAVCPECGETNCPCIARITVQSKLDEENAKGVRGAKKEEPISVVPQTFNQMSMNLELKTKAATTYR